MCNGTNAHKYSNEGSLSERVKNCGQTASCDVTGG